jgi:hypothetical protein
MNTEDPSCLGPSKLGSVSSLAKALFGTTLTLRRAIDLEFLQRYVARVVLQKGGDPAAPSDTATLLRLHPSHQPHLRRLPLLRVSPPASGVTSSHGVTGGVYKARERIHRSVLICDY